MVAVAYERWAFTRGSIRNHKDLTEKILVFWISGRNYRRWLIREAVAHEGLTVLAEEQHLIHNW